MGDVFRFKTWGSVPIEAKQDTPSDGCCNLTDLLKTAPHGEDRVFQMPEVGELLPIGRKVEKPLHEKVFYFMAYMNLIFVFLITFVIALWRWW